MTYIHIHVKKTTYLFIVDLHTCTYYVYAYMNILCESHTNGEIY